MSQVFVSLITKHSHYKNLVINLGNGFGFSVLNIIKIFRKVTKKKIIINFKKKKAGDISEMVSDNKLMKRKFKLNKRRSSIEEIVFDTYHWIKTIYK